MLSSLGSDAAQVIKFGFALVIILAVVGMFILILRRLTGGRLISSEREHSRSRQPRLGVIDVYDLDRSRQLVLLRRDNVEHLLLLGGANDVVIETNIVRVATSRTSSSAETTADRGELSFDRAPEPPTARFIPEQPARPVFEGAGSFRGGVGEHIHDFMATPDPVFHNEPAQRTEPIFETPPPAQLDVSAPKEAVTQAAIAAASIAAVAAATRYEEELPEHSAEYDVSIPDFLREQAEHRHLNQPGIPEVQPVTQYTPHVAFTHVDTQPEQAAPFVEPDVEFEHATPQHQFEEHIAPQIEIEPEKAAEVYQDLVFVPEPEIEFDPALETPEPKAEREVLPEQPQDFPEETPEATIHLDEAMLSDMARQLEEALKGSLGDLHQPVVTVPEPASDFEQSAQQTPRTEEHSTVFTAHAKTEGSGVTESIVWEAPVAQETSDKIHDIAAEKEAEQVSPTDQKPLQAQLAPLPKADDPFSVDDIEAEFARLLGRNTGKNDKT